MRGLRPRPRRFLFVGCPMHIIYVDESGTPGIEASSRHFVVAGLAMPLRAWKARDAQLHALLRQNRLADVELHAAWMARLYPEQQRIADFGAAPDGERRRLVTLERKKDLAKAALRGDQAVRGLRKNYAKTAAYIHLTHAERMTALRSVADALAGWGDARLFGDAHMKGALSAEQRARSREFALEQVTSRFNAYLANAHGPDALAIMVHDQHQAESLKLTALFRKWHEGGTAFTRIPHLAETPLFVDSSLTLMVQVADLVAYATRRFFDNGETDLFDRFYVRYDRTPQGLLVGLRHYTARTRCDCRVCLDHGR